MNDQLRILSRPALLYVLPLVVVMAAVIAASLAGGNRPIEAGVFGVILLFNAALVMLVLWASLGSIADDLAALRRRAEVAGWSAAEPTLPFSVSRWRTPCGAASWTTVVEGREVFIDVMLAIRNSGPRAQRRSLHYTAYLRVGIRVGPRVAAFTLRPSDGVLDTPLFGSLHRITLGNATGTVDWLCEPPDVAEILARAPRQFAAAFAFPQTRVLWFCRDGFLWLEYPLVATHEEPTESAKRLRIIGEYLTENRPFRPRRDPV